MSEPWYKKPKYCLCEDGFKHEGRMELVTWDTPAGPYNSEALGWGATAEDSEGLKRKFEEEFGGDEEKLFDYFPLAFRWTCCGLPGDSLFGCDHHGKDGRVCTCDFCKMGMRIPDEIHNERAQSAHGKGLNLSRGDNRGIRAMFTMC